MNDDLETQLHAALRAVPPTADFSDRVMARVPALPPGRHMRPTWWATAGLAAAVLLGVGLQHRAAQQRDLESGLRARRQVIEALQVTNQKLDLALRAVTEGTSS